MEEETTGWSWQGLIEDDRVAVIVAMAMNVIYAMLILVVALMLANWAKARIEGFARRHPKVDATLFGFLGNIAKWAVLVIALIFVLNRFGIQTTSLVAVIGAAGLAIGLALQGTLSNLAAGIMMVVFRPFRVGHYIEAGGQAGSVMEISLFYTELKTYDGLQVIVPNSDIWSSAIKNYSVNPTRMMDLTVGVSYGSDLQKAQEILERLATSDPRALKDPAPFVKVKELGASSVDFVFRVWANSGDWWVLKCDITRQIKEEFDANGIEIPFPTQTLFMDRAASDGTDQPALIPA
ncbi:mechanosensitive ion channel family protein [Frigidibacter oleivorans]|uniref:mechanosensitive ion channel family protein n=1 Tax=Frigidibacter oleivorans TaxID=2487129 RepID=UPI000F8F782B|nr:mechanosensitive ion channel domain-containing protein [Frigidibacter oleivorans]